VLSLLSSPREDDTDLTALVAQGSVDATTPLNAFQKALFDTHKVPPPRVRCDCMRLIPPTHTQLPFMETPHLLWSCVYENWIEPMLMEATLSVLYCEVHNDGKNGDRLQVSHSNGIFKVGSTRSSYRSLPQLLSLAKEVNLVPPDEVMVLTLEPV